MPWLFNFPDPGLAFDAALHFGTAIAVVSFFWRDFMKYIKAFLHSVSSRSVTTHDEKLAWYLVVCSIPGAIIGMLLEDSAASIFRSPLLIAATLSVVGIVLLLADRHGKKTKDIKNISFVDALIIGTAQAIAIIPGVSRSGITMTAGLMRNIDRSDAARFSFLLSAPITIGAALYATREIVHTSLNAAFFVGIIVSAVVGYLSIKYLLKFLQLRSFAVFTAYRLVLAALIVAIVVLGIR
jgi:undecaprenyl-diphosphatase